MKKAIKRMFGSGLPKLAALALAVLATGGAHAALKPIAVWNGDFNVTSRGGITLDLNNGSATENLNTVSADGKTITIGSGAVGGVKFTPDSGIANTVGIIVKYSNIAYSSSHILTFAGCGNGSHTDYMMGSLSRGNVFVGGYHNNDDWSVDNPAYTTSGTATGFTTDKSNYVGVLYSRGSSNHNNGVYIYTNGVSTAAMSAGGLHDSGFTSITKMIVGGYTDSSAYNFVDGKIHYVAILGGNQLTAADMATWSSLTYMTDSETISASGGSITGGSNVGVNLNGGTVNVTADTTVAALFVQGTTTLSFMGNAKLTVNGPIYIATGSTLKIDVSTMTSASQAYIIANGLISDFSQIELYGEEGGYDYSLVNDGGTIKVARLPARTFSYIAKSGQSPSGWFSSFNNTYGDNFTASAMRIGPDGDFVYETTSAAKPYADLSGRTTFTFSIYADISQMDADRKALMVAFGSGGGNNVMLYREGDYVRAGYYNGNTLKCASAVEVAAATTLGYHLYTIVCEQAESSNTITIYKDGIAGTSSSTSELVSLPTGFQISTAYGGNIPGSFWQGKRMAVAAMCGYDVALGSSEVAALALEYPVTDGKLPVDLNGNMTGVGLTLYESDTAESPHFLGYYNNGTITIPSGASVSVSSIRAANADSGGPATVNIAGDLTVWSTSSSYNA